MEFITDNGKIDVAKRLHQIGGVSPKNRWVFDFNDKDGAVKLLMYYYRRQVGHKERNSEIIEAYAREVIDWLAEGDKCFLILVGDTGCGKTTMLEAVCHMINDLYYSNISYERRGFQWESSFTISGWAKDENERFEDFKRCEWLAIDDLGQENGSEISFGSLIYPIRDIILYRYDNNLITIMTSNLPPKALTEKYGRRIGDRLAQKAHTIMFNETSYRRQ